MARNWLFGGLELPPQRFDRAEQKLLYRFRRDPEHFANFHVAELLDIPELDSEPATFRELGEGVSEGLGILGTDQRDVNGWREIFLQIATLAPIPLFNRGVFEPIERMIADGAKEVGSDGSLRVPRGPMLPNTIQDILHNVLGGVTELEDADDELDQEGIVAEDESIENPLISGPDADDVVGIGVWLARLFRLGWLWPGFWRAHHSLRSTISWTDRERAMSMCYIDAA